MATATDIRNALSYDPASGEFRWKSGPRAGKPAGCRRKDGYLLIRVGAAPGELIYAHRLAFVLMGEEMPARVDHKDTDPTNNRWLNLRPCTQSQNCGNSNAKGGASGRKGVTWDKRRGRWLAKIQVGRKFHGLGYFDDVDDAARAYDAAALAHFGEFARINAVGV